MKCPNCGQEFEGDRCPNCGRPRSNGGGRTAAIVILILLVMPCAAFGACSVWVGGGSTSQGGDAAMFLVVGVAPFAICLGLGLLVRKLWRG